MKNFWKWVGSVAVGFLIWYAAAYPLRAPKDPTTVVYVMERADGSIMRLRIAPEGTLSRFDPESGAWVLIKDPEQWVAIKKRVLELAGK